MSKSAALAGLLTGAVLAGLTPLAAAKEYLVTGVKPDKVVLVDPAARTVVSTFTVPDGGPNISSIIPSPDGRIAYAVCNRWESVAGIDLETGEQVFRADFSSPGERVKAMFAADISPDGRELFVFQSPVTIKAGEYEVQDTRVAVYDTSSGVGAEPVRTFPAPRSTYIMFLSTAGDRLYLFSRDLTVMDPRTGEVLETRPIQSWDRPGYAPPDILDVWPQWEQARMFSTPYYVARTDRAPTDPDFFKTGLLTVDLDTGEMVTDDFENFSTFWFSTVVAPDRRHAFGVYTTLIKVDLATDREVKRVDLPHSYYDINVSGDGKEIYIGGTLSNIGVYSSETLERVATIEMPDGANMGIASLRVVDR